VKAGGTFLVTGGAGSIGLGLVQEILKRYEPKTVRIFDNSDYALARAARRLSDKRIRCLLGDVEDYRRVEMALRGVDYVFHLAAIKDIGVTEYNPIETIRVNVLGTVNLVEAAMKTRPKKLIYISSDKAVEATTLYGATKFISEKLTLWGHQVYYPSVVFSVVRLGNVIETRGNVFEVWHDQVKRGEPITITDPEARRFFFNMDKAVDSILEAFEKARGGEIFVPDMEEFKIADLAPKHSPIRITGLRLGEKLREKLMTDEERKRASRSGVLWVIQSEQSEQSDETWKEEKGERQRQR